MGFVTIKLTTIWPFGECFLSFFPTTVSNRKSKKLMKMANPPEIQVGEVKTEFRPVETGQFDHKNIIGFPPKTKNVKAKTGIESYSKCSWGCLESQTSQTIAASTYMRFWYPAIYKLHIKNLYIYQWHTPQNWRQHLKKNVKRYLVIFQATQIWVCEVHVIHLFGLWFVDTGDMLIFHIRMSRQEVRINGWGYPNIPL